jgi:YesN/AraC family two-component response regulator
LSEKIGQLAVLLGTGLRLFAQRSALPPELRAELVDLVSLWKTTDFPGVAEVARARLGLLSHLTQSAPVRSAPVEAALKAIRTEYAKSINLESVADRVALSPHRLSRLFVEETGRGFSDYLIDYRIQKAKELLATGQVAVKEVSFSVGYQDPNYFSRLFKKATGKTPSEFAEAQS